MKLDPACLTAVASEELAVKAQAWFASMEQIDGAVSLSDFLEAAKKDTNINRILSAETVVTTTRTVTPKATVTYSNTSAGAVSNATASFTNSKVVSDAGAITLVDLGPDFVARRVNEKENLKSLNNRFASYIKKVRHLEVQNKTL